MKKNNGQPGTLAGEWFLIGSEELKFAESAFQELNAFYSQICFQCQQAVEKYLKGFLVSSGKSFPKIHDLVELVQLCAKRNKDFSKFLDDAGILSQYYITTRYPVEYPPAARKQAAEAIKIAQEIISFVKTIRCA